MTSRSPTRTPGAGVEDRLAVAGSAAPRSADRRPRILVLSFTDLASDPRVDRQVRFLAERHEVLAAGHGAPETAGVGFVPIARPARSGKGRILRVARLAARRYESCYWRRAEVSDGRRKLVSVQADLVVANDVDTLPLALAVARGARVLFDAHEYAPREFDDLWTFRLLQRPFREYLCRRYLPDVGAMTTVSEGIAEEYARLVGTRPEVVWNAPDFEPLAPTTPERDPRRIRLVHHGVPIRSRRLELMLDMMDRLDDRFELHLLLKGGDAGYAAELRARAGKDPRVHFHPPVPMRALPRALNGFDVGLFLLPPTNLNYRLALPNKFFEFVQARLAVAIGPSPEMARLSRRHELGPIAPDFEPSSMADLLSGLDRGRIMRYKERAHDAARALSADAARSVLDRIVRNLLDSAGAGPRREPGPRSAGARGVAPGRRDP